MGYVQSASGTDFGNAASTWAFSGAVSAHSVIAGIVWWNNTTNNLTSVVDGTNNYTILLNPTTDGTNRAALFYAIDVSAGSPTITTNFDGAPGRIRLAMHEVSGCITTNTLDKYALNGQTSPGTGADAITSTSVTTTNDGQYIFGATINQDGDGQTFGTGYTQRIDSAAIESEDQIQGAAGAIAATFTDIGTGFDRYLTAIMTFKTSVSGQPSPFGGLFSKLLGGKF